VAKRLIVCCDGTWNRPDQMESGLAAPTNVAKIALAVLRDGSGGTPQLLHYHPGVGTRRFERLRGGAFGFGISRNVCDCYRFLVENYEPGDELYLFGFSRGAFTARSLAGLVRNSGIVRSQHVARIPDAYRLYRARRATAKPRGIEAQLFRRMHSHPDQNPMVHFIGVWDTVGSLGIPLDGLGLGRLINRRWGFHDTDLSSRVRYAYQALAIDEERGPFRPTPWTLGSDPADQTLEQVWFSGVHCDIGGGYRDPALSEIALLWMADRASSAGLALDPERLQPSGGQGDGADRITAVGVAPDGLGSLHTSRKGLYRLLRRYRRPIMPDHLTCESVASSAMRRRGQLPDYRPSSLEHYDTPVTSVREELAAPRSAAGTPGPVPGEEAARPPRPVRT
jgi:uncharacterized protein (DUF2235 family)